MRIEFTLEGGIAYFPALSKPVAIEVDRLETAAAQELKRLVEAAHFFDLPGDCGGTGPGSG